MTGSTRGTAGAVLRDGTQRPLRLSPAVIGTAEQVFVLDALDAGEVAPAGMHLDAFEAELADVTATAGAVAVVSGATAFRLALQLVGVGPGDVVVVPTLAPSRTVAPVLDLGAQPLFVDVRVDTWTLDADLLTTELARRAAQDELPRAVVAVDLYGHPADHARIAAACAPYGVSVVEDATTALGATYRGRPVGSQAQVAVFSFGGGRTVTTGCGGALVAADPDLVTRARTLAGPAQSAGGDPRHLHTGTRLSNVLAALGRAQLTTLDARVGHRRWVHGRYRQRLRDVAGIDVPVAADWARPSHWLSTIVVDPVAFGATREDVRLHLDRLGITTRPICAPMHQRLATRRDHVVGGRVAAALFGAALCVPSGFDLSRADVDRVVTAVTTVPRH